MQRRLTALLGLIVWPLLLPAQAPRFEFTGQVVLFPVGSGFTDASAGDHRVGAGVRFGYRPEFADGRALLEVHANATRTGDVPTASGIRTYGVLLATTIGPVGGQAEGTIGIGISRFTVDVHGEELCLPPRCTVDSRIPVERSVVRSREGDVVRDLTRDASYTAVFADAGIRVFRGRTIGGRAGIRLYAPTSIFRSGGGDDRPSGRWELSMGVMVRVR